MDEKYEKYRDRCEKRCFHCMAELEQPDGVCPHCGYDNHVRINEPGFLQQTVLKDQYYVGRALGRGGFGVTYAGYDFNLARRVAVKEYFPTTLAVRNGMTASMQPYLDSKEQFERGKRRALEEGRLIANMGHVPNVVRVFNVFEENGTVYIVMEYIDGVTLAQIVKSKGRMEWGLAYAMLRPVMTALEAIHERGIIHRDVSPDNIMLLRGTQSDTVLLDFGTARSCLDEGNATRSVNLRPGFAPVEQYNTVSTQDGRVDEYALCATMYYLITGIYPVSADQRAYLDEPMPTPREMGAEIPERAEAVLLRGMAIRANDRYDSVKTLREHFEAAQTEPQQTEPQQAKQKQTEQKQAKQQVKQQQAEQKQTEQQRQAALSPKSAPAAKPKAKLPLLPAAVLLAVLIAAGVLLTRGKPGPEPESGADVLAATEMPTAEPTAAPTAEPTSAPTAEPTPAPEEGVPRQNVLMPVAQESTVFGSEILRSEVLSVTFRDSVSGAPDGAWDVSADKNGAVLAWAAQIGKLYNLTIAGAGGVRLPADSGCLFQGYEHMSRLDFGGCVDTSGVTDTGMMFANCASLTELNMSGFDTGNVTDMGFMFSGCKTLTKLDMSGFDTSDVEDMGGMFSGCASLTELNVSGFDTGRVTDMSQMFSGCGALTELDVSGFDTRYATDMSRMFDGCGGLTWLDVANFDTRYVKNMSYMFGGCSALAALNVSGFDTRSATDMTGMFSECYALTALDVSGFDTRSVTDMGLMFYDCAALTALDLGGFDMSAVTETGDMFTNCPAAVIVNDRGMTPERWLSGGEGEPVPSRNVLMTGADPLFKEKPDAVEGLTVFGSEILRSEVGSIVFKDSLSGAPDDAWDVSAKKNGAVLAWAVRNGNLYDLTIAGEGGVRLNKDSSRLFYGYTNMTRFSFGGCVDASGATNMVMMFNDCEVLPALSMRGLDTGNVTNMQGMFNQCFALTALDLRGLDTGGVTDMNCMFSGCEELTALDVSGFDTHSVRNMSWMFNHCASLTALDVSGFDTRSARDMSRMFNHCKSLAALDVSGFDTRSVTDMTGMFCDCSKLTALDLGGFDMRAVTESADMLTGCPARITANGETMTPAQWQKSAGR